MVWYIAEGLTRPRFCLYEDSSGVSCADVDSGLESWNARTAFLCVLYSHEKGSKNGFHVAAPGADPGLRIPETTPRNGSRLPSRHYVAPSFVAGGGFESLDKQAPGSQERLQGPPTCGGPWSHPMGGGSPKNASRAVTTWRRFWRCRRWQDIGEHGLFVWKVFPWCVVLASHMVHGFHNYMVPYAGSKLDRRRHKQCNRVPGVTQY